MDQALHQVAIPAFLQNSQTYYVVVTDLAGNYTYVNDVFNRKFSFISSNFIGLPSFITIYPEDHGNCLKAVEQCLAQPGKVVQMHLRKPEQEDGVFYWTSWEFVAITNDQGQLQEVLCIGHDITDTELASRQARSFAQQMEATIEDMSDGFYELDRNYVFVRVNRLAEDILAHSRLELMGRCFWDFFSPDEPYQHFQALRLAMNGQPSCHFNDHCAGRDRWFGGVVHPSANGITVFLKDTTAEWRTAAELQQQKLLLQAIYNSTSEGISFSNTQLRYEFLNHSAKLISQQVFGREVQLGEHALDYILPEYKEEFARFYERILAGEAMTVERSDGQRWWHMSYYPVYAADGVIMGLASNVRDISDQKQKQQALEESELRLQKTMEAIPHPLLILNKQGQISFANERFECVFGYAAGEAQGRSISTLLHPEEQGGQPKRSGFDLAALLTLKAGPGQQYLRAQSKRGSDLWVNISLNHFSVNGERLTIAILQDVTEAKHRQDIILHQNELLKNIAWQQSHELRRPVVNILGLCDIMKNYPAEDSRTQNGYVDMMMEATQELDQIVRKIVDTARRQRA